MPGPHRLSQQHPFSHTTYSHDSDQSCGQEPLWGPLRQPSALMETGSRVLLTSQSQLNAPQPTDVPMRALERVLKPCVRSWPDAMLTTVEVAPL